MDSSRTPPHLNGVGSAMVFPYWDTSAHRPRGTTDGTPGAQRSLNFSHTSAVGTPPAIKRSDAWGESAVRVASQGSSWSTPAQGIAVESSLLEGDTSTHDHLQQVQRELIRLRAELSACRDELEEARRRRAGLQSEKQILLVELQGMQDRLEDHNALVQVHRREAADLKLQNCALVAEREELQTRVAEAWNRVADLEGELRRRDADLQHQYGVSNTASLATEHEGGAGLQTRFAVAMGHAVQALVDCLNRVSNTYTDGVVHGLSSSSNSNISAIDGHNPEGGAVHDVSVDAELSRVQQLLTACLDHLAQGKATQAHRALAAAALQKSSLRSDRDAKEGRGPPHGTGTSHKGEVCYMSNDGGMSAAQRATMQRVVGTLGKTIAAMRTALREFHGGQQSLQEGVTHFRERCDVPDGDVVQRMQDGVAHDKEPMHLNGQAHQLAPAGTPSDRVQEEASQALTALASALGCPENWRAVYHHVQQHLPVEKQKGQRTHGSHEHCEAFHRGTEGDASGSAVPFIDVGREPYGDLHRFRTVGSDVKSGDRPSTHGPAGVDTLRRNHTEMEDKYVTLLQYVHNELEPLIKTQATELLELRTQLHTRETEALHLKDELRQTTDGAYLPPGTASSALANCSVTLSPIEALLLITRVYTGLAKDFGEVVQQRRALNRYVDAYEKKCGLWVASDHTSRMPRPALLKMRVAVVAVLATLRLRRFSTSPLAGTTENRVRRGLRESTWSARLPICGCPRVLCRLRLPIETRCYLRGGVLQPSEATPAGLYRIDRLEQFHLPMLRVGSYPVDEALMEGVVSYVGRLANYVVAVPEPGRQLGIVAEATTTGIGSPCRSLRRSSPLSVELQRGLRMCMSKLILSQGSALRPASPSTPASVACKSNEATLGERADGVSPLNRHAQLSDGISTPMVASRPQHTPTTISNLPAHVTACESRCNRSNVLAGVFANEVLGAIEELDRRVTGALARTARRDGR